MRKRKRRSLLRELKVNAEREKWRDTERERLEKDRGMKEKIIEKKEGEMRRLRQKRSRGKRRGRGKNRRQRLRDDDDDDDDDDTKDNKKTE